MSGRSSARSYHFHSVGGSDLVDQVEQLRAEDPHVAEGFQAEVASAIERLLQFPDIGSPIVEQGGLLVRKWKLRRFRYSILYAVIGDEIRIYAVAHHSRSRFYWTDRL